VKKGQFVAPEDMRSAVGKIESTGNRNILLTERGSCFGYRTLVVDFRSLSIMRELGYPVVFDVTHSVRIYGRPSKDPSGGEPRFIPLLARAGAGAQQGRPGATVEAPRALVGPCEFIIGNLDHDGFLRANDEEIMTATGINEACSLFSIHH